MDTFDRVQDLLAGRSPLISPRLRSNLEFPLRHFVLCGKCGKPLTASWSRGRSQRYAYYRCQNRSCREVNIRREELEKSFGEFLEGLKPKPEYLRLFGEIIVDVWKQKQSQATSIHDTFVRRLKELRWNKDLLVKAFLYERSIDKQTYQEQLDKLTEEITFAELEERDARLDELDIESTVAFAHYVLLNASRLWTESSHNQKQRVQKLIFPEGVRFENGLYRTTATSMIFFDLGEVSDKKESLVALTGIEPVFED